MIEDPLIDFSKQSYPTLLDMLEEMTKKMDHLEDVLFANVLDKQSVEPVASEEEVASARTKRW